MPDHFEELFARARPVAVQTIRPPGTDAARQTVRRRRRRRAVAIGVAAVLVVLGGVLVRPGSAPPVVAPVSPERLGQVARNALGPATGPVAVEKQGEVRNGWSAPGYVYFGEQQLIAACAGTGSMTLVVTGVSGLSAGPSLVRELTVPCSDVPEPVSTRYFPDNRHTAGVEFSIVNAVGTAGFAFRVLTPDTGEPLRLDVDAASPNTALQLTEKESRSGFGMSGDLEGEAVSVLPETVGGRFTVAVACAGVGRLEVTIRRVSGGTVDTWEMPCRWPPERHNWKPAQASGDLELQLLFVPGSDSTAGAHFAVQVIPK
ncbi:hypothetical protein [Actinoplanes derwentensis]|uniref:Uncharacterized protein n=1 Tax=Actinoplanes derwentensis TaxID=113562 RepID=A0A1H2CLY3_9ACTN|nr:hypothetical protein [Actinoplanes derwentensis]GID86144.1 hypothetical protein Ade03nite_50680 [Actinoplanes derwentensis]SDT71520.1 hypothetical protein SAMN04489716_6189 [Actinoplanes derwentensis]